MNKIRIEFLNYAAHTCTELFELLILGRGELSKQLLCFRPDLKDHCVLCHRSFDRLILVLGELINLLRRRLDRDFELALK